MFNEKKLCASKGKNVTKKWLLTFLKTQVEFRLPMILAIKYFWGDLDGYNISKYA